jgi:predicted nucleotidyltransferase component of viral defense system
MAKTILTENQTNLLFAISGDKEICRCFYLTGGTALAEFYLHHRLSEDLDFFSEDEFDVQAINVFFKKNKIKLGFKKIDYQQSFNRNLFFIHFDADIVKTEFTYFPFVEIQQKTEIGNLRIDGALDIAVNKIFTIYQNPRARDFIDLYCLHNEFGFQITDLAKKARIKFDVPIDYLQLGSNFLLAAEVKDYPVMKIKINRKDWQNYFINEAKKLKTDIIG